MRHGSNWSGSGAERGLPRIVAVCVTLSESGFERLAGISLTVRAGEVVALVGAGESGKASVLRLLAGHVRPSTGALMLCGAIVRDTEAPSRLVQAHLRIGVEKQADLEQWQDAQSSSAAMGAAQPITILEEPVADLTEHGATRAWRLIRGMADRGQAVLVSLSPGDLPSADLDRLYFMQAGLTAGGSRSMRTAPWLMSAKERCASNPA